MYVTDFHIDQCHDLPDHKTGFKDKLHRHFIYWATEPMKFLDGAGKLTYLLQLTLLCKLVTSQGLITVPCHPTGELYTRLLITIYRCCTKRGTFAHMHPVSNQAQPVQKHNIVYNKYPCL